MHRLSSQIRPRTFLGIAMFLCLTWLLQEPVHAKEINVGNNEFSAILYDKNNGLPTSEANAIVQTRDGFIWIGSYSGLIRYDGNDFVRYDSQVGIASVMSLYEDSRGRLWIGTNDSGVALYESGEFQFYTREEGLRSLSIRAITEDAAGNIILATTQGIAYIDLEGSLQLLPDERINNEYINSILRDENGIVYGITTGSMFFAIEDLQITHCVDGTKFGSGVSCICPVPGEKGQVYLGTWDSQIIVGDIASGLGSYQSYSVMPQSDINKIFPDGDRIWICADNGIGFLEKDGTYTVLKNVPLNNSVDYMMKDYEGSLWFASSRQGIMEITTSPFTDVSKLAGLENMVVNSTCMYQGDLYIGTDSGLVVLDNHLKRKENDLTALLKSVRIRCIKADTAGRLWLCTYGDNGLVSYDGTTYVSYNESNGLVSNWVRTIEELPDNTLAVAASGGLTLIRDGKIIRSYTGKDGIENTEILTVCEGEDGKLYLGSDGDGIYILEGEKLSHIGMEDGLKSEIILRIKREPGKSRYWIITSNSISCLENGKIKTIMNFPYSNNFDMYFNQSGEIWILSSNGIYVVNSEKMYADEELEYTFYDLQCGLPYVTTANSRSYLSEDGTLYISGSAGVSSINIDQPEDEEEQIKLSVPFMEVDDEMMIIGDKEKVVIPAECTRLTIYGCALTYRLHNPHLYYQLKGFDEEGTLTTVNEMRPVSYTNLFGGDYEFTLSILDEQTGEVENTVVLQIQKEKALHEQVWFRALLLAVVILLAIAITLFYMKKKTLAITRKNEENRRLINQMTSAFAKIIDLKDQYTNGHSFRVAKYSKMLAQGLGYSKEDVENIYNIALLHDIGKISIPDEILNKPGKLTPEEYEIIKSHARNGYDILKEIEASPELALGAGYHHERIDGTGYPSGKSREEIPMVAQIISVADTFDAMNSTRPYRKQMKMEDIAAELARVAGTQLNPDIVKVLLSLIEQGAF